MSVRSNWKPVARTKGGNRGGRDLLHIIRDRHSSRGPFDLGRPVPRGALRRILEAARWAPTAHNMQNFEVVVVDDPAVLGKLGKIKSGLTSDFIKENYRQLSFSREEFLRRKTGVLAEMFPPSWTSLEAREGRVPEDESMSRLWDILHGGPVLLVVLYDSRERAPASQHDVLGFISLGCVMENMWLMAESLGLGFHIISAFSSNLVGEGVEEEARRILGFPGPWRIAFTCRLGYPVAKSSSYLRVRRDLEDFCHRNRYGDKGLD